MATGDIPPPGASAGWGNWFEYLARPSLPPLQALLAYWNDKRSTRLAPARADIGPEDLKAHLPTLFLVDVVDGGQDFRFRLIGTRLTENARRDSTGRLFSDVYGDLPQELEALYVVYRRVVQERQPLCAQSQVFWFPHAVWRLAQSLLLPLSDDGAAVTMVLGETRLVDGDRTARIEPGVRAGRSTAAVREDR